MSRKTGLAFSGGGIRSAAFCSGVLRRMLQKYIPVDYLSCVSGGGYTGTAYLDWKYRNELKDDPAWHADFFENMRRNPNPICNCGNALRGIVDTAAIICLILVISLILPVVIGFTFAIPTAYLVDYFFGAILRLPFTCPQENTHNFTTSQIAKNPEFMQAVSTDTGTVECVPKFGPHVYPTFLLFVILFSLFLFLYFLKGIMVKRRTFVRFLFNLSFFILAMTFLPWLIEQYIVVTPLWINGLIIGLSIFLWLGFPPLRDKASLVMIIYFYAYAIKWKVYKTNVLGFVYTHTRFAILMWVSGILIWINPFLALLQQRAVQMYNQWRLQKSFFSPESTSLTSCPRITCCQPAGKRLNRPLTLGDLIVIKPHYICNVTVHHWRKSQSTDKRSFELLTMSPSTIERIDHVSEEEEFEPDFIKPTEIKLSVAMATSAAVVSYNLGTSNEINEGVRDLQILMGLGLGKFLSTQTKRNENCIMKVIPVFIQFLLALPIVVLPIIPLLGGSAVWDQVAVIAFITFLGLLTFIAILPTGQKDPGCFEQFVRWCIIHVYHVRAIRELMSIVNTGPKPPPIMSLSDGGHVENLGLLPLLKLRLPRIVVVNGSCPPGGTKYDIDLLNTLNLAREKLRCSFSGMNGRDISEDVRVNFIEKQPRSYKFRVDYYEKLSIDEEEKKVGEGEIILLAPRYPGPPDKMETWSECLSDIKVELKEPAWGSGPVLEEAEVDRLTGCCCECCHSKPCNVLLGNLCGRFPLHLTANQLFTPAMFSAYHREGYRACVEAAADKFLAGGAN